MKACRKLNIGAFAILVLFVLMYGTLCCLSDAKDPPSASSKANAPDTQGKYKKLALLVGINDYPYVYPQLRGSVNDVENMKQLLVQKFGFPNDNILVLTNQSATRDGIINGIKEHLIAKASSDSIVVFHYSGHGSQIMDVHGDEMDKLDETIVPYDSGHKDPHPNRDITDDDLLVLLNQLTEKTPNVTLIFDSCHSGTINRGAGLSREVERDKRVPTGQRSAPVAIARGVDKGKSGLHPANARHAVISGCTSAQSSYEMEINGKHYGAFTWYFAEKLWQAGENVTYRDIMDQVKMNVTAKNRAQEPQLEGPGEDQLVFGDKSMPSLPYILTKRNPDGTITLNAGQVQGVTKGSIYDVYPPGTKSFGKNVKSVAQIEITAVETTFSKAKVTNRRPISDGSRAVEREHHWPAPVLRVHFTFQDPQTGMPAPSVTLQKIKDEVAKFNHITIVPTANGYDLLLRDLRDPKTGKQYIITEGGDPTEISPRVPVEDANAVALVIDQITQWAKWYNILRIENHNADPMVDFVLVTEGSATTRGSLTDRKVNLTLVEGNEFTVHVANKSSKNLYLALLDLSSSGKVSVLFPVGGEQEFIVPGLTLTRSFKATLSEGQNVDRDVLKLFATTSYADFSVFEQPPVRGGVGVSRRRGQSPNPLEELLADASLGSKRGVERVAVGGWATNDRIVEVRRRNIK
jgi:hypothetical protein